MKKLMLFVITMLFSSVILASSSKNLPEFENNRVFETFKCNSWTVVLETEINGVKYLEYYEFNTQYYAYAFASLHNGNYNISYNPCGNEPVQVPI